MKGKMFKPYDLALLEMPAEISRRKRVVEVLSRPIPGEQDGEKPVDWTIMVRMVPGDPTTLREVDMARLTSTDVKYRWVHVAEVVGAFSFPEDMLRYDGASLVDPDQPEEPVDEMGRHAFRPTKPVLIYRVTERKNPGWTDARWASFSWAIRHKLTLDLNNHDSMVPA